MFFRLSPVLLLLSCLALDSCLAIRLEIKPKPSVLGSSEVNLNCKLDSDENGASQVVFIQVVKHGKNVIASVSGAKASETGTFGSSRFKMEGSIDSANVLNSFVNLTLSNINKMDLFGAYKCEVFYKDAAGSVQIHEATGDYTLEMEKGTAPTAGPKTNPLPATEEELVKEIALFKATMNKKVADLDETLKFYRKVHKLFEVDFDIKKRLISHSTVTKPFLVEKNQRVVVGGYNEKRYKSEFMDAETGIFYCPIEGTYDFMVWKNGPTNKKVKWILNGCNGVEKELKSFKHIPRATNNEHWENSICLCKEGERVWLEAEGLSGKTIVSFVRLETSLRTIASL